MRVLGLDGCKGGWVVASWDGEQAAVWGVPRLDALDLRGVAFVGVDMPIGLPEAAEPGGRPFDRALRRHLGPIRGRSVFSPPVRAVLHAPDYPAALAVQRASSPHGLGLSKQAWFLVPKIREVEGLAAAAPVPVVEIHPEAAFADLVGAPIEASKKTAEGRAAREAALARGGVAPGVWGVRRPRGAAADDVLDALAVALEAWHLARGGTRSYRASLENPA